MNPDLEFELMLAERDARGNQDSNVRVFHREIFGVKVPFRITQALIDASTIEIKVEMAPPFLMGYDPERNILFVRPPSDEELKKAGW